MKLTIFGSTGPTGKILVGRALEAGHEVTAYARNPGKLDIRNPRLKTVQGELTDFGAIEGAIGGADAVLSALGPPPNHKGTALSAGARNIVDAMKKQGVRRLIFCSTPSARDPEDKATLQLFFLRQMVKLISPEGYREIIHSAEIVRASNLDWTLVRLQLLNNKPRTEHLITGYIGDKRLKLAISRENIAHFMLQQLTDTAFVRKAPVICDG